MPLNKGLCTFDACELQFEHAVKLHQRSKCEVHVVFKIWKQFISDFDVFFSGGEVLSGTLQRSLR